MSRIGDKGAKRTAYGSPQMLRRGRAGAKFLAAPWRVRLFANLVAPPLVRHLLAFLFGGTAFVRGLRGAK